MVTLNVRSLTIGYERPLVHDINIVIRAPHTLLIVGPNGVGKTTFLKTLTGLIKPHTGRVYVNEIDVTGNSELAGMFMDYVPQLFSSTVSVNFPISVWEFIEFSLVLHSRKRKTGIGKNEMRKIIREVLSIVGIDSSLWHRSVWKLSGGGRQRLLIARALANNQPIILLDEPLSSIDPEGKVEIVNIISSLRKDKILMITSHDPEIFLSISDDIMVLGKGVYYIGKPSEILDVKILEKIYGGSIIKFKDHIHIHDYHS